MRSTSMSGPHRSFLVSLAAGKTSVLTAKNVK